MTRQGPPPVQLHRQLDPAQLLGRRREWRCQRRDSRPRQPVQIRGLEDYWSADFGVELLPLEAPYRASARDPVISLNEATERAIDLFALRDPAGSVAIGSVETRLIRHQAVQSVTPQQAL